VAIIMDGNGRWARKRGLERNAGHAEGADSVREVLEESLETEGLDFLTLFALGRDNLRKRPRKELQGLFALLRENLRRERHTLTENNVRFRVIGDIDGLPRVVRDELVEVIETTAANTGKTLCVALNYSGRDELTRTFRRIAKELSGRQLRADRIDEQTIEDHLDTAGMPQVDLLIRTSGEMRLSDFLLWQVSYAELYVTATLWPDFRKPHFKRALASYRQRERRFGGVKG
jgi:undecaprenyl diphosphate synthase